MHEHDNLFYIVMAIPHTNLHKIHKIDIIMNVLLENEMGSDIVTSVSLPLEEAEFKTFVAVITE